MMIPRVTSILLVVLVSISLLSFILKYYTYFVLVVASLKDTSKSLHDVEKVPHPHDLYVPLLTFIPTKSPVLTRPWVFATSTFVEETFMGLALSVLLIFYLGKYVENLWGTWSYTRFNIVNIVAPNVIIYVYYVLRAVVFKAEGSPPVVLSCMAINMALLVAIKQRISSHYIILFKGNLRIKVTHLPFLLMSGLFVLQLISDNFVISFLLSICGFILSWVHLRFFKVGSNERQSYLLPFALNRKRSNANKYKMKSANHQSPSKSSSVSSLQLDSTPLKGDRSEQFSLYTFFPYPLSPIVKMCSQVIFDILVHYKFFNANDFMTEEDDADDDISMLEDTEVLKTNFFGLSSLKGAGDVSAVPKATSTLKMLWEWAFEKEKSPGVTFKTRMNSRRKLALRELD